MLKYRKYLQLKINTKCIPRFLFVCCVINTVKFPEVYRDRAKNDHVMMLLYKSFQKIIFKLVFLIQFCPVEFKYIYNLYKIIHQS